MLRKIFKTGNSVVVSLPKDAIDFLQMEEGSEVSVELDREKRRIVITRPNPLWLRLASMRTLQGRSLSSSSSTGRRWKNLRSNVLDPQMDTDENQI